VKAHDSGDLVILPFLPEPMENIPFASVHFSFTCSPPCCACIAEPDLSEDADPGGEPAHQGAGRAAALAAGAQDDPEPAGLSHASLLYRWAAVPGPEGGLESGLETHDGWLMASSCLGFFGLEFGLESFSEDTETNAVFEIEKLHMVFTTFIV